MATTANHLGKNKLGEKSSSELLRVHSENLTNGIANDDLNKIKKQFSLPTELQRRMLKDGTGKILDITQYSAGEFLAMAQLSRRVGLKPKFKQSQGFLAFAMIQDADCSILLFLIEKITELFKDVDERRELLEARIENGFTPLQYLACMGSAYQGQQEKLREILSVAKALLDAGVPVDTPIDTAISHLTFGARTALHLAVHCECVELALFLLTRNANPNIPDSKERTTLHLVAVNPNLKFIPQLLRSLFNASADPSVKDFQQETPFFSSIAENNFVAAEYFFKKVTEEAKSKKEIEDFLNERDSQHATALMYCVTRNLKFVQTMVEAGANIDLKDSRNQTALMYASEKGSLQAVKYLVERRADYNVTDNYRSALSIAIRYRQTAVVEYLLGLPTINLETGLIAALMIGDAASIRLIISANNKRGGDLNRLLNENLFFGPPLCIAALAGHEESCQILIDAGADMTQRDRYGNSIFTLLAFGDRIEKESICGISHVKIAQNIFKKAESIGRADLLTFCPSEKEEDWNPANSAVRHSSMAMLEFFSDKGVSFGDFQLSYLTGLLLTTNFNANSQLERDTYIKKLAFMLDLKIARVMKEERGIVSRNPAAKLLSNFLVKYNENLVCEKGTGHLVLWMIYRKHSQIIYLTSKNIPEILSNLKTIMETMELPLQQVQQEDIAFNRVAKILSDHSQMALKNREKFERQALKDRYDELILNTQNYLRKLKESINLYLKKATEQYENIINKNRLSLENMLQWGYYANPTFKNAHESAIQVRNQQLDEISKRINIILDDIIKLQKQFPWSAEDAKDKLAAFALLVKSSSTEDCEMAIKKLSDETEKFKSNTQASQKLLQDLMAQLEALKTETEASLDREKQDHHKKLRLEPKSGSDKRNKQRKKAKKKKGEKEVSPSVTTTLPIEARAAKRSGSTTTDNITSLTQKVGEFGSRVSALNKVLENYGQTVEKSLIQAQKANLKQFKDKYAGPSSDFDALFKKMGTLQATPLTQLLTLDTQGQISTKAFIADEKLNLGELVECKVQKEYEKQEIFLKELCLRGGFGQLLERLKSLTNKKLNAVIIRRIRNVIFHGKELEKDLRLDLDTLLPTIDNVLHYFSLDKSTKHKECRTAEELKALLNEIDPKSAQDKSNSPDGLLARLALFPLDREVETVDFCETSFRTALEKFETCRKYYIETHGKLNPKLLLNSLGAIFAELGTYASRLKKGFINTPEQKKADEIYRRIELSSTPILGMKLQDCIFIGKKYRHTENVWQSRLQGLIESQFTRLLQETRGDRDALPDRDVQDGHDRLPGIGIEATTPSTASYSSFDVQVGPILTAFKKRELALLPSSASSHAITLEKKRA